jgi:toxin ParE1/3/4
VKSKAIVPRELAERDVQEAIAYYFAEGGAELALRFIDALEAAYTSLSANPASGSPRYVHELDLPGLRVKPITLFPYLMFYVEQDSHLDLWRVLHPQRDIPAWLREPE